MAGRKANRNNPANIEKKRAARRTAKKEDLEKKVEVSNDRILNIAPADVETDVNEAGQQIVTGKKSAPVPPAVADPFAQSRSLLAAGVAINESAEDKAAREAADAELKAKGAGFESSGEVIEPIAGDKVVPKTASEKADAAQSKVLGTRGRKRGERADAEAAASLYPNETEELTPSGVEAVNQAVGQFNKPLEELPAGGDGIIGDPIAKVNLEKERELRPVMGPDTRTQTASTGSTVSGTGIFTPLSATESAALPIRRAVAKPDEVVLNNERRIAAGMGIVGADKGTEDLEHNGEIVTVPKDLATAHKLYLADYAKNPAAANRKALGIARGDAGTEVLHPHTHANIEGGYHTLARVSNMMNIDATETEKRVKGYAKDLGLPYTDALLGLHNIGAAEQRSTKFEDYGAKVGIHPDDTWVHPETGEQHRVDAGHPDMPDHFLRSTGTLIGTYRDVNGIRRVTNPSYLGWHRIAHPDNPNGAGVWNLIKQPEIPQSLQGPKSKLQTMTGFLSSQVKTDNMRIGSTTARALTHNAALGIKDELEQAPQDVITSYNEEGERVVSGKKPTTAPDTTFSKAGGFTGGSEGVERGLFNIPFSHVWDASTQFDTHIGPKELEGITEQNIGDVLLDAGTPTTNKYGQRAVSTGKNNIVMNKKTDRPAVVRTQNANIETLQDETGAGIPTPPVVVSGANRLNDIDKTRGAGTRSRKYIRSSTGRLFNPAGQNPRDAVQGFAEADHTASDIDKVTPLNIVDHDKETVTINGAGEAVVNRGRIESARKWDAGLQGTPLAPERTSHGYSSTYDSQFTPQYVQDALPGFGMHSSSQFLGMPKVREESTIETPPSIIPGTEDKLRFDPVVHKRGTPRTERMVASLQASAPQGTGPLPADASIRPETPGYIGSQMAQHLGLLKPGSTTTQVSFRDTEPEDKPAQAPAAEQPMFPDTETAYDNMIKFGEVAPGAQYKDSEGKMQKFLTAPAGAIDFDNKSGRQWLGTLQESSVRTVADARSEDVTSSTRVRNPIKPTQPVQQTSISWLNNEPSTAEDAEVAQDIERHRSRRDDLLAAFGVNTGAVARTVKPKEPEPGVSELQTDAGVPFRTTTNPKGARMYRGTTKKD